MIAPLLAVVIGFAILVWSADRFIDGAASTASHLGMPPLLIGIVIVGFGTSMPEMLVSAQAALDGNPDLALGNALGSNIINTGLVLGVTALIAPIIVDSNIVRKEIPLLILIGLIFGWLVLDGELSREESTILLIGFVSLIALAVFTALKERDDVLGEVVDEKLNIMPLSSSLWALAIGLILMIVSSKTLIWGAITFAQAAGVSNLVIGLTIVALGTSLPELTASIMAALKNQHDIAIGNVVGSNMFNLLAVAGIAGFIAPIESISDAVVYRDWAFVMFISVVLWFMAYGYGKRGVLSRTDGALLLTFFTVYMLYLARSVQLI